MKHLRFEAVRVAAPPPHRNPFMLLWPVDESGNAHRATIDGPTYTVIQVLFDEEAPELVEHKVICANIDRATAPRLCAALEISVRTKGTESEVIEHMITRLGETE